MEENLDLNDWRIASLRISDISVDDSGDFSCGVSTVTDDNPIPNRQFSTSSLQVYYPPTRISLTSDFNDEGLMTAKCEIDAAFPDPTFQIETSSALDISMAEVTKEESVIFSTFEYQLSPSVSNEVR